MNKRVWVLKNNKICQTISTCYYQRANGSSSLSTAVPLISGSVHSKKWVVSFIDLLFVYDSYFKGGMYGAFIFPSISALQSKSLKNLCCRISIVPFFKFPSRFDKSSCSNLFIKLLASLCANYFPSIHIKVIRKHQLSIQNVLIDVSRLFVRKRINSNQELV